MTTNDFRIGDIVSYTDTITDIDSHGNFILGDGDGYPFGAHELALVERPEAKVSVEISFKTIQKICEAAIKAGDPSEGSGWDLADRIRAEILEKLHGND